MTGIDKGKNRFLCGFFRVFCFVLVFFFFLAFIFWWDWGLTWGFVLAWQALHHLTYTSSTFCSGYFGDGVSLYPGQPGLQSCFPFPAIARMTGLPTILSFFCVQIGILQSFFVQASIKPQSSQFQHTPTHTCAHAAGILAQLLF
jgi:hypothetical protein